MDRWMTKSGIDDRLLSLTNFHYIRWMVHNLHIQNKLER